MKNQKGFIQVILILVIVVVAIGGAYYFGTFKNKSDLSIAVPTSTPVASNQPIANSTVKPSTDSTVNWKTYTDPDRTYSIKYPPSWTTKLKCNGGIPNDTYICLESSDLEQNPVPAVQKGKLVIIDKPGGSSFVINDSIKEFCKETSMSKYKSCDTLSINGITMVKKVWSNFSFIDVAIFGLDGTAKVSVRFEYPYPSGYSGTDFDQILSTFKFTNQ